MWTNKQQQQRQCWELNLIVWNKISSKTQENMGPVRGELKLLQDHHGSQLALTAPLHIKVSDGAYFFWKTVNKSYTCPLRTLFYTWSNTSVRSLTCKLRTGGEQKEDCQMNPGLVLAVKLWIYSSDSSKEEAKLFHLWQNNKVSTWAYSHIPINTHLLISRSDDLEMIHFVNVPTWEYWF